MSIDCSPVFLPHEGRLARLPRKAFFPRPARFFSTFEEKALIYDCFWHGDGSRILLLCPPPMSLGENWRAARFFARGQKLAARFFKARSSMLVELCGAPSDSIEVEMKFAGMDYTIPVQKNLSQQFAGSKIVFTMNRNNPLEWICEWARFHATMHNANGLILFDNGSDAYDCSDIEQALARIAGFEKVLVVSWPYRFGSRDPGVLLHPYWAHFLQNSAFSHVLRRFGAGAHGLLNMDIDELADPVAGSDVFEMARGSPSGFHVLNGRWVENIMDGQAPARKPIHTDFTHVLRDIRQGLNARKWALDPSREWLEDLAMQPSWHKIKQMPKSLVRISTQGSYWHFRGINTNWKHDRSISRPPPLFCRRSPELAAMFKTYESRVESHGQ